MKESFSKSKEFIAFVSLIIASLACGQEPIETSIPTALAAPPVPTLTPFQPIYPTTDILATPTPSVIINVESTPPFSIIIEFPQNWITQKDEITIADEMNIKIKDHIDKQPNQYIAAIEKLPQNYLDAVVNLEFISNQDSTPMGGTATCIGINYQTGESIFLTSTHVINNGSDQFHIKHPQLKLDIITSISQSSIATSPNGDFEDIAVFKLPFIPQGISEYLAVGQDLCYLYEPRENALVYVFSYPFINGGYGYTGFFGQGNIETIFDASGQSAQCWYGSVKNISSGIYLPTNLPNRPGASGSLVLDENMQGIGIITGTSPHGALVKPVNSSLLSKLITQTGFSYK